jgi:hypothetical protein
LNIFWLAYVGYNHNGFSTRFAHNAGNLFEQVFTPCCQHDVGTVLPQLLSNAPAESAGCTCNYKSFPCELTLT